MKRKFNIVLNTLIVLSLTLGLVFVGSRPSLPAQAKNLAAPIYLQADVFRPAAGELPDIPPDLTIQGYPAGERGIYLVQFNGPVQEEWKAELSTFGVELLEYIPDFAFKARMTPGIARLAAANQNVAWVGLYQPAYKIDPALDLSGTQLYRVRLEKGGLPPAALRAIEQAGAELMGGSGDTWLVRASPDQVNRVLHIPDVAWVEAYSPKEFHNEYGGGSIMGSGLANTNGYDGSTQIVGIADTGINTGNINSVPGIPASRIVAIYNWPGVNTGCINTIEDDGPRDITGHGTHTSGSILSEGFNGYGRGTAPAARLVFQAMENWVTYDFLCFTPAGYSGVGFPDDLHSLFQQAYGDGARIHSDSWGGNNNGDYNIDSVQTDDFAWFHKDFLLTFSAGNFGKDSNSDGLVDNDSMAAPGTAKNVITVGASENNRLGNYACDATLTYVRSASNTSCGQQNGVNEIPTWGVIGQDGTSNLFPANPLKDDLSTGNAQQMAGFSSRGPTDDNRIKPDVVAPGTWILSTYSDEYQEGYDATPNPKGSYNQWGGWQFDGWGYPFSRTLKYNGGTSMSSPLVAGGAAVVRDYFNKAHHIDASAALVKAALINSAVDLLDENNDGINDNDFPIPNAHEGWGLVRLDAATDGSAQFVDQSNGLSTGGYQDFQRTVNSSSQPLKISLVWTDYPSTEAASVNLVNDLDLKVTSPSGTVYLGNVFSGGWSQTGGNADRRNNVENVYIQLPLVGNWSIQVIGYNVPNGPQQPFALVMDGSFGPPNTPPIADNQTVTTTEDTSAAITLTGSDPNGDLLTYSVVAPPSHGTLTGTAPNLIYSPGANYNGSDSFAFKVNDGWTDSAPATVSITITPVNDAPVATPQSVSTTRDTALNITLTGSDVDGDSLTFSVATVPSHGNLTGSGANLTYTPSAGYTGSDGFIFTANDGSLNSPPATISITVNDPLPNVIDQFASSEATVSGTMTGSYLDTQADGGGVEVLKEIESGGKPNVRYSLLEHKWTFTVQAGSSVKVYANGWAPANADSDTFSLAYSTDGVNFTTMFYLPSASSDPNQLQSSNDLGGISGTITIRVVDSNRVAGKKSLDSVYIDHLYIQTDLTPVPLPAAPSGLTATAVSASQVNLAWTDNATNEAGYYVERTEDGTNFIQVASLPANAINYSDSGLADQTTYTYRVQAYNFSGGSAYSNTASATTPVSMTIHVGNLTPSSTISGSKWTATVTILVHNSGHQPLEGVIISGAWSDGATGTASCVTGANGTCTLNKANIKTSVLSVKFTVTGLAMSGYTYDPGSDHIVFVVVNQK